MISQKRCIITDDITGITHTVTGILSGLEIDILMMEVMPGKVYIKTNELSNEMNKQLKDKLTSHKHIYSVESVSYLPIEIHQKNLEAILSAIQEIVVAVDLMGNIILFNPVAEKILKQEMHLSNLGKLMGKKNQPIVSRILKGENFSDEEIWLDFESKAEVFFLTAQPLLDEDGQLIGAFLTFVPGAQMKRIAFRFQRPELNSFDSIIYKSKVMENAVQRASQSANSDAPVMLRGDSGTGKELFARAIHYTSGRKKMPFVPINCAAIPDSLIESELFGYEPGAFTGAGNKMKMGLIEVADGGTLFLDEVGELPLQIQAKLLRVLQDGNVRRIGANKQIQVNFRIIAATNKDLEEMVSTKQFREDLYYRLNVVPVEIPPLLKRTEDIPLLVANFLERYSIRNNLDKIKISKQAMKKLMNHSWKGNIRELENVLERGLSQLTTNDELDDSMLIFDQFTFEKSTGENQVIINEIIPLEEIRAIAEKELIRFAMRKYSSTRKLAELLDVSHMTIANKLNKYRIKA